VDEAMQSNETSKIMEPIGEYFIIRLGFRNL